MLFSDAKSGLTRLSDAVKLSIEICARLTRELLELRQPHRETYREYRVLGAKIMAARSDQPYMGELKALAQRLPGYVMMDHHNRAITIHSQALSTVLLVCFTAESYANSLAHYLRELGAPLPESLNENTFENLRTIEKWQRLSKVAGSVGLDPGRAPLQDLAIMFKFRNDHVHDKVVDLSHDRTSTYNGKFPDPIAGTLDLGHAMYAAATYWSLVEQLHKLIELPSDKFHRHRNLSPWRSPADRIEFESLANDFRNEIAGS